MPPWPEWAWPMCPRAGCSPISPRLVSNGCSRTGAFHIEGTTCSTLAADKRRRRSPCWLMRCATEPESKRVSNRKVDSDPSFRTFFEDVLCHRKRRKCVRPADIESQVGNCLRDLGRGQAVIHSNAQVRGQLRALPVSNERAHGYEASVARRKVWAKPQVTKQNIRGVLNDTGKCGTELLPDALRPVRLRGFVERQQRRGRGGQLVRANLARGKHVLRHRDGRHRIRPPRIESQMRDGVGNLGRLHAIIES